MKISQARFVAGSTRVTAKPKPNLPEFAFIGRSNVGKSSLINMLCGRSNLALTSSTPGKTRAVNHFLINNQWYLVDLPGYGFAKMSKKEKDKLHETIRDYVSNSREMVLLFVLIDSRHELQQIDLNFLTELGEKEVPFSIIFTKGDKLGPVALQRQTETIKQRLLEFWEELPPCFVSSAESGLGKQEILDFIGSVLETFRNPIN